MTLKVALGATQPLFQKWASDLNSGNSVPFEPIRSRINDIQKRVGDALVEIYALDKAPEVAEGLVSLDSASSANQPVFFPEKMQVRSDKIAFPNVGEPEENIPSFALTK